MTTTGSPRQPSSAAATRTRARIVAAAEQAFADRGLDSVSLNEINRAAGQRNKTALQYHFGSKEGLLHAILDKHMPGIETRRTEMLDAVLGRKPPSLRPLVEALVIPIAEKLHDPDGGIAYLRLVAEMSGSATYPIASLLAERTNRAQERLAAAMDTATPECPEVIRQHRNQLVTGLVFRGLADFSRRGQGSQVDEDAARVFVRNLVDCVEALCSAPVSSQTLEAAAEATGTVGLDSPAGAAKG